MPDDARAMQMRIEVQAAQVAALRPGSPRHEMATNILLLLRDALHVQHQIDALEEAQQMPARRKA